MTARFNKLLWGLQGYPHGLLMSLTCRNAGFIRRGQVKALRRIVEHARKNVAYYKGLEAYGSIDVASTDFEERFRVLPLLRKDTIVGRFADLVSNTVECAVVGYTSGSTGLPMKFLKDLSRRPRQDGSILRRKLLTGRSLLRERVAYIAEDTEMMRDAFVWRQGFGRIRTFFAEDSGLLESLSDWKPTVISGWPDSLRWLCRRLEGEERRLSVPYVVSHSSVLDDVTRREFESTFGAVVINEYGLNETGDVASTMCGFDHLHVDSESFYVETVDGSGLPVADGEPGEIVITVLHNYSFPMIRYATGDVASLSNGPFECRLALPALLDIQGRKDDMIVLANGRTLTIAKMNMFFWGNMDLRRWRIFVEDPGSLVVECEWREHAEEPVRRSMLERLHRLLGDGIRIRLVETGIEHDRTKKMKYIIRGRYPKAIVDRSRDGP